MSQEFEHYVAYQSPYLYVSGLCTLLLLFHPIKNAGQDIDTCFFQINERDMPVNHPKE